MRKESATCQKDDSMILFCHFYTQEFVIMSNTALASTLKIIISLAITCLFFISVNTLGADTKEVIALYMSNAFKFFIIFIYRVVIPLAGFMLACYALLNLTGHGLYRWDLKSGALALTARITSFRFKILAIVLVVTWLASHLLLIDGTLPIIAQYYWLFAATIVCFIEACYSLFILVYARQAIHMVKNNLPNNSFFMIYTTQDGCWVYSTRKDTVFRTVLASDDSGNWLVPHSYPTSEKSYG
jgi:hypothetical protein